MIYAWSARATEPVIEQQLARAVAALQAKRADEAIAVCDDLLKQVPGLPRALALKSRVRAEAGDVEDAILLLEHAIASDPGVATWHANLAALYRSVYRCADAVRSARQAVRLEPKSPQHLVNLALALINVDDRDQAIICLLRAVGEGPDHAIAHLALAQMLLARGEMAAGWIEYEWRNKLDLKNNALSRTTSALWNGMRLPGRLLVISDQGYGDTIQFSRFIPLAAERCQELIVACKAELASILSPIEGVSSCLTRWDKVPGHTAHIRISSLPYALDVRSEQEIPAATGYLKAPADRVEAWRKRLASLPPGKRIGFAWKGSASHPNDWRRSIKLSTLRPLLKQNNVQWVSLQKPVPEDDAAELARSALWICQTR